MRYALAAATLLALALPASAEVDADLMDLSLGDWMLVDRDGASCPLTLGDEPMNENSRRLDGGGDCRSIDPAMTGATAWRIDTSGELVILNDSGKTLLRMKLDKASGSFRAAGHSSELALEPAE